MPKIHVLLIYGGQSSEHEGSLMSARNIYAAMDKSKYEVTLCFIDKAGNWCLQDGISDHSDGCLRPLPVFGQQEFLIPSEQRTFRPDVIFPALHGKWGEDGTMQGFAAMMNLPCVGPSVLGAALTMEKYTAKRLLEASGVPTTPGYLWRTDQQKPDYVAMSEEFGDTMFVKPSRSGSSVGVRKVKNKEDWDAALAAAAEHDSLVLIEKAIDARELEVAVLGNSSPRIVGPGEINLGEEFYSYDDKYAADSKSSVTIPADIDDEIAQKLRDYALKAYSVTGGWGMARVDFFVDKTNKDIYLNEINSIPGFTDISMYPKLWQHEGLERSQLVDRLIELAMD